MIRDVALAVGDMRHPAFRRVLWRSLALTILTLAALGAGVHYGLKAVPEFKWGWINTGLTIVGDMGAVVVSILLAVPMAALVVTIFLDEVAEAVERRHYPADSPGRMLGLFPLITTGLGYLFAVLVVNFLALPLYFVPGANIALFVLLNGYLIGRQYFELVAFRHKPPAEAGRLRRRFPMRILLAGIMIALALGVPVLNLFAPLFGTALMVHLYKNVAKRPDSKS